MPGSMIDIFNDDAFSMTSLTDAIQRLPHKPMRLEQMGLFEDSGIDTLTVAIEMRDGELALVPNVPRGAPGAVVLDDKRVITDLRLAHLPQMGAIMADEVQGIRAFGQESARDTIQAKINRELGRMRDKLDVTIEWMKIGALKGLILQIDKAGNVTTLHNMFTVLGVSPQTHNIDFSDADMEMNEEVRKITRLIEAKLGAFGYTRIHAFAGPEYIDALLKHPSVKQYVVNWNASAKFMEDDLRYAAVRIGNVVFEEYRGVVNGTAYIEDDEAYYFPVGVPNMFRTYFGPANYNETVNTMGLPYYAKSAVMKFEVGIEFQSQSNPLPINQRPEAVVKSTGSFAS